MGVAPILPWQWLKGRMRVQCRPVCDSTCRRFVTPRLAAPGPPALTCILTQLLSKCLLCILGCMIHEYLCAYGHWCSLVRVRWWWGGGTPKKIEREQGGGVRGNRNGPLQHQPPGLLLPWIEDHSNKLELAEVVGITGMGG